MAAIAIVLLLAACGGDEHGSAARTTAAFATTAGTPIVKDEHFLNADDPGVLTFENGDCFRDPATNEALGEAELNSVECVGAQNEVYTFETLPDGPWDAAAVARAGWRQCGRAFGELWGPRASSPFSYYPALPTRRSWNEDRDRSAMCVVYSPQGRLRADPIEARGQTSGGG
ncbi:hypothetical protein [Conexibacter sp. CPCC 206217]|uniref:hypothetical protein n=1 Tax=Conexibacter sp. CPCC 206217 TaxID=3064574 RepID=UPI002726DEEE|nr:hypothetical protein [Conexibacter sp. CPCC 206217]MDO8208797.1 hypothetical protein [Conexibacter sp. CPCC 206217]